VVENYFAACGKKDLAGAMALWSEKSPNLAAYRQNLGQQFTIEDLSYGSLAVSQVKVEHERASLRATIALTSINIKSQQKSERRLILNFVLVKEGGATSGMFTVHNATTHGRWSNFRRASKSRRRSARRRRLPSH
jgi:hypothetical protein